MKINKNYCFLLIMLILIILFATSLVSATDNITKTQEIENIHPITKEYENKTSSNYNLETTTLNTKNQYETTDTPAITSNQSHKNLKSANFSTIYVSSYGSSENNGENANTPTTLSNAINNIADGGSIYLVTNSSSDTYTLNSSISLSYHGSFNLIGEKSKNITLQSSKNEILHIYQSSINITNINFVDKHSTSSAIYIQNSKVNINNCSFTNNYRNNYSSCIYASSSNVSISATNFINNTGLYGASIYTISHTNLTIKDTLFENNQAKLGGCLYAKNSFYKITKSKFKSNNADYGGALYLYNTRLDSNNNLFEKNNATYYGGAIVCLDNETVKINNTNFSKNNASTAGAIYVMYAPLTVENSTFDSNNADAAGCVYSYNNTLSIQKSALVSNVSNESMVVTIACKKCNLDNNWWGINNPNFNTICDGFIPNTWIIMRLYDNHNESINVTLNELSNGSKLNTSIKRIVKTASKDGLKTKNPKNIVNTLIYPFTSNDTGSYIVIDNQIMEYNSKVIPIMLSNDVISKANKTISINISSNKDISGNVTVYINNKKVKTITAKERMSFTYTLPGTLKEGTYNIDIFYSGNSKYNSTNSTYNLIIQSSTYDKTNNITPTKVYKSKEVKLPSYYNMAELNLTTPVKTQGSSGSCITFASMAALESSIKKLTNTTYDFSENNLKNIFKRFSTIGYPNLLPNDGGFDLEPVGYFVSGLGPVLESVDEYDTESVLSQKYSSLFQVQNVYFINHRKNYTDNNLIKEAILKYGGVFTSIQSSSSLNIYSESSTANHVVCIVGWDDNYSKSNFGNKPAGDGAFIIKNSWGTHTGNEGYQYVSYYDHVIGDLIYQDSYNDINFAIDYNNLYNYSKIYQYDTVCYIYSIRESSGSYSIKNIYTIDENQAISAVGTYFVNTSNYTIKLYINDNLVTTKKGSVDYPGYRTIYLDNFYRVNKYDEVVVTIDIEQKMNPDYIYVPLQDSDYPVYSTVNKSFISYDNQKTWEDLYTNDTEYYVAPIKVYTMDIPRINSSLTYKNNIIKVTTEVLGINSSATIYYKLNNEYLYNSNNKAITNKISKECNVTITNSTVGLSNGNYILETILVYNGINITQKNKFTINKNNITLKASDITAIINETKTLTVNVIDNFNSSKTVNDGIITLTYNNNTIIGTAKVKNGQAKINLTNTKTGNYTVNILYSNSTTYNDTYMKIKYLVKTVATKLTVSTNNTYVLNTSVITGKLTDKYGNPISNAVINIQINNQIYTAKTNATGEYKYNYKNTIVAKNNVTVTYNNTTYYASSTKSLNYTTSTMPTKITLTNIKGTIGEKITLKATVTDNNNNPVDSGYVIFKINSVTVKDNGQINGSSNALKVYVKNGVASCEIIAYLNVRYGQNLTAVYSGTSNYQAVRSATAKIDIVLRNGQIVVKCNTTKTKQDTYIKFTATIYDVTSGKRSSVIHNLSEQYVYFKVNGITMKNDDGTVYQAKVVNGVATYDYKIPQGFMGITDAKTFNIKNHTVTAGLYNKNYYPTVVNYTYFQVERSSVNITVTNAVINNKTHKLSLNATMKDYKNNYLVGPNKIIIKVNGVTLTDSKNKVIYFMIDNGRIQLKDISIPAASKYTTITIVTQDRLGYQSARCTSTKITIKN